MMRASLSLVSCWRASLSISLSLKRGLARWARGERKTLTQMEEEDTDVGDFWLPSEFLGDEFVIESRGDGCNSKPSSPVEDMDAGEFWLPSEFLGDEFVKESTRDGCNSKPSSESDEDEHMAAITRKLSHVVLKDENDYQQQKPMSRSPQSTLTDYGSWSTNESPNGQSQVSSPPLTPPEQQQKDLLADATSRVVRLRLDDRVQQRQKQQKLLGTPAKPSGTKPEPLEIPTAGFYPDPVLVQKQMQAQRFYLLKQQQLMKQKQVWGWQQNRANGGGRPLGLPSTAWPQLQRTHQSQSQANNKMRVIFLNGTRTRKESVGTGVFLPQRPENRSELRQKRACSTVLLPERVVRALNLDEIGRHRFHGSYLHDHHDAKIGRDNELLRHQSRNQYHNAAATSTATGANNDLCVPAKWTYEPK